MTDNATRFVAGSSEKSKAYLRTFDVNGRLFQLALSESGLLFSGYNGDYGSSGKTLWEGVARSDLTNNLNHKKQILPWGNYRDGSHSISNFKFGSNLYIAVGASSKVQKRCSIMAANDSIQIPHPEGFITIVFNNLRNVDAAVKGSLLDYAKNVSTFENVSTGENTADLPNNNARYCVANIMHRANSWFISIEGRDNRLYTNYNNGDSWTGWQATALKSDLANKTKSGSATISTKQNDSTALQIRFDEPFPSRPYVTVSLNTDNANTNTKISVFGIDQTGFKVSIYDTAATTRRIEWIASV